MAEAKNQKNQTKNPPINKVDLHGNALPAEAMYLPEEAETPSLQIAPDERYFVCLDKEGNPQRVDLDTGETIPLSPDILTEDSRQKNKLDIGKAKPLLHNSKYDTVWIPRKTSLKDIEKITGENKPLMFSSQIGDIIISEIMSGRTLSSIMREPFFPSYRTFTRWCTESISFGAAVAHAKLHRAEAFFDMAIDTVHDLDGSDISSDMIKLSKLKSDVYKYAAKIGDQSKFGDKQHISGDMNVGHYMIETGIRRSGDPGFKVDETKKLVDRESNLLFGDVPAVPEEASLEDDL